MSTEKEESIESLKAELKRKNIIIAALQQEIRELKEIIEDHDIDVGDCNDDLNTPVYLSDSHYISILKDKAKKLLSLPPSHVSTHSFDLLLQWTDAVTQPTQAMADDLEKLWSQVEREANLRGDKM
jgi:hypothetical protein